MQVLKQILDRGAIGEPVFAQIDMHAIPHWQGFLKGHDRLTLSNMSVHHLDALRFLFGDPEEVTSLTRTDPRTEFAHKGGIVVTNLRFPSGLMALSLEDVRSGSRQEGYADDQFINRRVEGTRGVARGTIGWPSGAASTLSYNSLEETGGKWVTPEWETMWFPHAFIGVMEQLQYAIKSGTPPVLNVADNVRTMALVEAAYQSINQGRTVRLDLSKDQGRKTVMMHTGIFTGYFPYGLKKTCEVIKGHGFTTVQLDLHFKDIDVSDGQMTAENCRTIRDTFRDHNLPISCISGYTNIVHPDAATRCLMKVQGILSRSARWFGPRMTPNIADRGLVIAACPRRKPDFTNRSGNMKWPRMRRARFLSRWSMTGWGLALWSQRAKTSSPANMNGRTCNRANMG